MEISRAESREIDTIMHVYVSARETMIRSGNPLQWREGYPTRELILKDIESGWLYVCRQNGRLVGCFALLDGEDDTYKDLYDGAWLNDRPCSVVHRLAVLETRLGVGAFCIHWCLNACSDIKVDTHADNLPMQRLLEAKGFQRCGKVRNSWGDERIAFQISR